MTPGDPRRGAPGLAGPASDERDGGPERVGFDAFRGEHPLPRASARVGFPDHHVGADLVGGWHKRNLRI